MTDQRPCPNGHRSETSDYCSVCGTPLTTPAAAGPAQAETQMPSRAPTAARHSRPAASSCVECGHVLERARRRGALGGAELGGRGAPRPRLLRDARARRDGVPRDHLVAPGAPPRRPGQRSGGAARPRGSNRRSIFPVPWRTPACPTVTPCSCASPEGTWALVDQGSTNGTYLNGEPEPIPPNHPIPLSDGDKIHVGAWTTVAMERLDAAQAGHADVDSRPSKDTRNLARPSRRTEIDLLGPLRLRVAGEEVPIGAAKKRAVLALLALRVGSPVSAVDLEYALVGRRGDEDRRQSLAGLRRGAPAGASGRHH